MTASLGRWADEEARPDSVGQADAVAREIITQLARRRATSGFSQAHIARLMQTSQSAVARLESGRHDVQLSTLIRYAEALGLSLNLVEDAEAPAGDSNENPGPRDATPEGRPGGSAVITEMLDRPDPEQVLTWRQREILQAIKDFVQERGRPPSMREIGEAVGLASTSSVASQLANLQRKGYLHRRPQLVEVRLSGDALASREFRPEEDKTAGLPGVYVFRLPRELLIGEGALSLVQVVGDPMSGAAIIDGDWAVIRQSSSGQDGLRDDSLVAAEIDGVPTVGIYNQSDGHIRLGPCDRAYMPAVDDEKASMIGRVIAIVHGV